MCTMENAVEVDSKSNNEPSRELVAKLLQDEIRAAHDAATRPGWTIWAIYAALASIIWVLMDLIESGGIDWRRVGLLFIATSIFVDAIYIFVILINNPKEDSGHEIRFLTRNNLSQNRLHIIGLFLREAIILVMLYIVNPNIPIYQLRLTKLFLFATNIVTLLFVIFSFILYILPKYDAGIKSRIVYVIMMVVGFIASLFLLYGLLIAPVVPSILEWRVASILLAGSILLLLLARDHYTFSPTGQLESIYRQLCLGRINASQAAKETDLALYGLTVDIALQPKVGKVLEAFHPFHLAINEAKRAACALRQLISNSEASCMNEDVQTTMSALKGVINNNILNAKTAIKNVKAEVDRFRLYMRTLKWSAPTLESQAQSVLQHLMAESELAEGELEILFEELDTLRSELHNFEARQPRHIGDVGVQ